MDVAGGGGTDSYALALAHMSGQRKDGALDPEAIADEVLGWEEEFEAEKAREDTAKDVRLISGWGDDDQ